MKKFIVALCALAMIAGAVSCKKDDPVDPVEDDPVVTEKLAEGIYQPAMKIASITTDIGDFEEWSWGAKNLDHITGRGEEAHSVTFGYAGDYVSKVIGNGEEWRYFYSSNQLSSSQLWVDNAKVIEMSFDHSADGKINSARIDIDESYLMQMLGGMIGGGGFPFANLLNRSAMESLAEMAKISAAVRNNAKFSVGSLNVGINFQWDGENVKNMMLNAGIAINIDTNDLNLIESLGVIPEEFSTYIAMARVAMAFTGGVVPLQLEMNDTVSYTYDNNRNPFYCYLGNGIDPKAFSYNNVTIEDNHGAMTGSVSLMGQNLQLINNPINDYMEYNYEYNAKGYPTKCESGNIVTLTYLEN